MGTISELLLARDGDDRTGLLFEDERYTWAEVVAQCRRRARLARELRPAGRPFHIGVLLDNTPEYLFWLGAAALSGAVLVGVNPTRRGEELARDIRHTDCGLIVTDVVGARLLDGLDIGVPASRVVTVPGLASPPPDSPGAYGPAVRDRPVAGDPGGLTPYGADGEAPGPGDTLMLTFTSGSTGAPKAVICTHGRLAAIAETAGNLFGITRDDVVYVSMPLFHGNSVMVCVAPALRAGAAIALRRRFSASGFLPDVRRHGATFFSYVGRALAYVLATPELPDDRDNPLVRGFGTEASARDMAEFERRFGCRIIEGYGSSEGTIAMNKAPGTPPQALGLPRAGQDVAIIDPETGKECPRAVFDANGALLNPGEAIGEIVGRNVASAFEGYYKNPEAEAVRLRDGWYWSGDLGYRDEAGYFYFAGRDADRLRVDGENFAAAPVERILARHAPVVMAAVYAVPDPRTGDQVMAALELRGGAFDPAAFAAFLAEQPDLGTKWAPRFVRIVDAMPLTASNKVDKRPLREAGLAGAIWWRPGRGEGYRPFTAEDRAALSAEFEAHDRGALWRG
ncbi:AMP-binding protein [Bailinhaonella thermotolerans]|uniref:Acyl-CoA synthetase n=1 Tax=Bailinhaonella thermotolerans TaxID=1070861 RepID=A0A3A4BE15_9ACTN|nr:AMP-binding protein [Bailinhaonella thermotolerans]RJL32540.1 acyl-CoA synthetase [Bailinhaonella thermotolerans]